MFDKEIFKKLLLQAMGDLNTTEYSKQSGVNRTYISKLLNEKMDNPPSPEILRGLASVSKNNVTYTDFMKAAGYIDRKDIDNYDIRNPYEDKEKYPKSTDLINFARKVAEENGYDISEKTNEEIAQLILKGLKVEDINK